MNCSKSSLGIIILSQKSEPGGTKDSIENKSDDVHLFMSLKL